MWRKTHSWLKPVINVIKILNCYIFLGVFFPSKYKNAGPSGCRLRAGSVNMHHIPRKKPRCYYVWQMQKNDPCIVKRSYVAVMGSRSVLNFQGCGGENVCNLWFSFPMTDNFTQQVIFQQIFPQRRTCLNFKCNVPLTWYML